MNVFEALSTREIQLIGASLAAAAKGTFFPDWEFETLFGMTRQEIACLAERWPHTTMDSIAESAAINALVNLLGYPHGKADELRRTVGDPEELTLLLDKMQTL
jgi:hypothetical protein